jgi:serine/threonine-protein kinase
LTGKAPIQGSTWPEIQQKIQRGDWPPARQVKADTPRPLEAICSKAMALQPEDRYRSALELAADLEHWLGDEPVTAYQESVWARVGRWMRRHRTLVASAVVLLGTAAIALAASTALVLKAQYQTEAERNRADQAHQMMEFASLELANALLSIVEPLATSQRRPEAEAMVRRAIPILEQLTSIYPDRHNYASKLASAYYILGLVLEPTRTQEAEQAYRQALVCRQNLLDQDPTRGFDQQQLARTRINLANLLFRLGKLHEVEGLYRQGVQEFEKLVEAGPTNPDHRADLAKAHLNWANFLASQNAFTEARQVLQRGIARQREALKARPQDQSYWQILNQLHGGLVFTLRKLGDHATLAALAEEHSQLFPGIRDEVYNAACFLSLAIPAVENDAQLPEAKRQELAQHYGDRAVALLREAVQRGFHNAEHMKNDPDLEPLRRREDFQKLLKELE